MEWINLVRGVDHGASGTCGYTSRYIAESTGNEQAHVRAGGQARLGVGAGAGARESCVICTPEMGRYSNQQA